MKKTNVNSKGNNDKNSKVKMSLFNDFFEKDEQVKNLSHIDRFKKFIKNELIPDQ